MKIGPDIKATSAISGSNAETIVVRGRDLVGELIGRISFTDHVWLLVTGSLPSEAQRCMLDATLVAIAEHGLVPSVVAARMTLAASPEAMQGAVAAGLLGCGSVIGHPHVVDREVLGQPSSGHRRPWPRGRSALCPKAGPYRQLRRAA